jgi:hypothetical protein
MTAVWIMSYLFASMCGAIAVLAAAYYLINRSERKQARENLRADNAKNLTRDDLSVGNLY